MKEFYPYRFKTQKELFTEYGDNWRRSANFNWYGNMDYLCGKTISMDIREEQIKYGRSVIYDGWNVNEKMITKNIVPVPNYNPRKISRKI